MTHELLDTLQAASREFQEFVGQVSKTAADAAEIPTASRLLEKIDFRLKHVSQCLGVAPKSFREGPEAVEQFLNYRDNLKSLKASVETLQVNLLAEKTRLENARGSMKAVRAWADSVRETS